MVKPRQNNYLEEGKVPITYMPTSIINQLTIKYIDDRENYLEEGDTINIIVQKNTSIILNSIDDAKYRTNVTINGRLIDEDKNGLPDRNITLTIGDEEVNLTTTYDGIFNYTATLKYIGEQMIIAKYAGTYEYKASESTITIVVNKKESVITINDIASVTCNENVTITGMVNSIDGTPLSH